MANEGEYPKVDGDVYYAKDANIAYYQELNSATMNYGAVSVLVTATIIKAANTIRKAILIRNHGSASIYIGADNTVTTATGQILIPGESIKLFTKNVIYGIGTETTNIRYLEVE